MSSLKPIKTGVQKTDQKKDHAFFTFGSEICKGSAAEAGPLYIDLDIDHDIDFLISDTAGRTYGCGAGFIYRLPPLPPTSPAFDEPMV